MNTLKRIFFVISGLFAGSMLNMMLLIIGSKIIPLPKGVDFMSENSIKSAIHLFEFKHFIFPFLAHALGTFFGAWLCARLMKDAKIKFALLIGLFFLIGGTINVIQIPAPWYFNVIDLIFAYIPMAYLAGKISLKRTTQS